MPHISLINSTHFLSFHQMSNFHPISSILYIFNYHILSILSLQADLTDSTLSLQLNLTGGVLHLHIVLISTWLLQIHSTEWSDQQHLIYASWPNHLVWLATPCMYTSGWLAMSHWYKFVWLVTPYLCKSAQPATLDLHKSAQSVMSHLHKSAR